MSLSRSSFRLKPALQIASAADDLTVCIWDAATGAAHFRLRRHDGRDDCKVLADLNSLIMSML
jgi:hypothetical protein